MRSRCKFGTGLACMKPGAHDYDTSLGFSIYLCDEHFEAVSGGEPA